MTDMRINADFTRRCVMRSQDMDWTASPMAGVERKMLERIGGEHTKRATSIVRYAPGSHFSEHTHTGGEEFLVLEGVFSDETGDYPAGTYIRNPIGTKHAPHSDKGCTIFVKLQHFETSDQAQINMDTRALDFAPGISEGLSVLPLHQTPREHAALVHWRPGTYHSRHAHRGGEEILVLDGVLSDEYGNYEKGTWLRNPHMSSHRPYSEQGCLIYVKTGHLMPDYLAGL
ncbi:MAG: cupin domain-containing protein [Parvularculaceae bacterium]